MTRCCLCRHIGWASLERTKLPGSGYRCSNHDACRCRVAEIVSMHRAFAEICEPDDSPPDAA